jgi:hypothetical protein
MNYQTIKKLQTAHGLISLQDGINDGSIWKLEGSSGRRAMDSLNSGECMLPKKETFDYYNNTLPSRDSLQAGTKGTYKNSLNFWTKVESGEIDLYEDEDCYEDVN